MKYINLGKTALSVPAVGLGFWRAANMEEKALESLIAAAMEEGINFFDHADIYGKGLCEEKFGKAVANMAIPREKMIIQSKCGIVPGVMYDFSEEHIVSSVEGILGRLGTDYLDVLLLHRPDALIEPEEVASAFDKLHSAGKVRHFGVSNHRSGQIELMRRSLHQDIAANQMQFGLGYCGMISQGFEANTTRADAVDRDGEIIDYCRLNSITIQTWSPFQTANKGGVIFDHPQLPELNEAMAKIGEKYSVSKTAVATAWVLRHSAKMQLITGTMSADRIREIAKGAEIELTREEWYTLYKAAGHTLP
ncbi:MAG: aldo/keto reductase [Oscillospiraceae bacterium]|nr:aldo/keto reductase [Oscillospiraceae bacterium]